MKLLTRALNPTPEKFIDAVDKAIIDYEQNEQSLTDHDDRKWTLDGKANQIDGGHRNNDILIYGLHER
jgi:hypothetical protein